MNMINANAELTFTVSIGFFLGIIKPIIQININNSLLFSHLQHYGAPAWIM